MCTATVAGLDSNSSWKNSRKPYGGWHPPPPPPLIIKHFSSILLCFTLYHVLKFWSQTFSVQNLPFHVCEHRKRDGERTRKHNAKAKTSYV